MEPRPWGHRHPDDPRTSSRWVQLTNHGAICNEAAPRYSESVGSHCGRPCTCATLFSSNASSIRSEDSNTLHNSIFVLTFMRKRVNIVRFYLVFRCRQIRFSPRCLGPGCVFAAFFFPWRSPSGFIEWFPSLSPTEGCCCCCCCYCSSHCGCLIAWKLDFTAVWQTLQTTGERPYERRAELVGGASWRCRRRKNESLHKCGRTLKKRSSSD